MGGRLAGRPGKNCAYGLDLTANTLPTTATMNRGYNRFLLFVAGLGGLLYGIDVGIIGGALPYLNATTHLSAAESSAIVAAVLLGSVISTLFAGLLADWMGRKPLMVLSGLAFVASVPVIALSHGYEALLAGRLLQGVSAGLIGVVVPLYLAECLSATARGKGTGIFQWMLTAGIFVAACMGMYYSYRVDAVAAVSDAATVLAYKEYVWRSIFWMSMPPGALFVVGSLVVGESPRWLFRRGKREATLKALLRSRNQEQAELELHEMEQNLTAAKAGETKKSGVRESLLKRKYIWPFLLACLILSCNTATGVNSVIGFNTIILLQSGLSDLAAHWGYVLLTAVNFFMTMLGMTLVDRKGRKFLLVLGTSGIIVSIVSVGVMFLRTERYSVNRQDAVQAQVTADGKLSLRFDQARAAELLAAGSDGRGLDAGHVSLAVIYSCGDFSAATNFVRSDDAAATPLEATRAACLPTNKVDSFFKNPFADLDKSRVAPLRIDKAVIGLVPDKGHGWLVALGLYLFMASYAVGPGVCVWLALSELMPTRIRSNGMSIALLINQLVSTTLAGIFLPFVAKHGYSSIFFLFAGFTLVYFVVAAFFLPETKGKTLEEIEAHFAGKPA